MENGIAKTTRWILSLIGRPASAAKTITALADDARDARRFERAAELYYEVVEQQPKAFGAWVQLGHVLKEAGHYHRAESAYCEAQRLRPENAEIALQLGHFYDLRGDAVRAKDAYRTALALRPGWLEAQRGVDAMILRQTLATRTWANSLAPTLIPSNTVPIRHLSPGLTLHQAGTWETTPWGNQRTLRGLQALRGYFIGDLAVADLGVWFGDIKLYGGPISSNASIEQPGSGADRINKAVFNVWVDCSTLSPGPGRLILRSTDQSGVLSTHIVEVVVARPVSESEFPCSDALISVDPEDPRCIEQQIRDRPSSIRPARRSPFTHGVRSILALRTDQLGDLVASIPALRRLREIAPQARIVGLVTAANSDLARTLNIFDELITIDFPDNPVERRRVMPLAEQCALRDRLVAYAFDIAIDLAPSNVSRELLQLSGARFKHGFGGGEWPWLQGRLDFTTYDRWNRLDIAPHSTKTLALVEALGTLINQTPETIRRNDLSRSLLEPFGLLSKRFIVLHTGARIQFSRWPHFADLARRLSNKIDHRIVAIDPDAAYSDKWPMELVSAGRIQLINEALPFDEFDAFLSFAEAVIGNDSGPKHLAALRGTPVVTLFSARVNWNEWGQESTGTIISRRVPCAGCAIFHDADECGKDFACIREIRVDEVAEAVVALLRNIGGNG